MRYKVIPLILFVLLFISCHKEDKPDHNFLAIDKSEIRLDTAVGSTQMVTINSSVAWTAEIPSGSVAWLKLDTMAGAAGKTIVKVSSIKGNPTPTTAAITFRAAGRSFPRPVVLMVTQKAYGFSIGLNKLLGGSGDESSRMAKTADGGFIIAATTNSANGDVHGNHGGDNDAWIIRLNNNGDTVWTRALGGSGDDAATAVLPNFDGSSVVVGFTTSDNGDITDKRPGFYQDLWVVKLDPNGRVVWSRTYGGSSVDGGYAITAAPDGGYVVAGLTASENGDVAGLHGYADVWMMKLDGNGRSVWSRTYGGSDWEEPRAIVATTDGYVVAGLTFSSDGDVKGYHVPTYIGADFLVLKVDLNGNKIWARAYGGTNDEVATSLTLLGDEYVVAGYATSTDGDVTGLHGNSLSDDMWVVKLNKDGNIAWENTFGGSSLDAAVSVAATPDGGILVGGATFSNNGDVSGLHKGDGADGWLVKLDGAGNKQWTKVLGGSGDEQISGITVSGDGYCLSGFTTSGDGDVAGHNHGNYDLWVMKLVVQ
ncbi:MAG: T9SS C-terminal target domain-containing protein [Bacteroidetes bacterium]|nr:T9SS C-terminal target domain-containing protein [Bacteroidota bacterium]